MKVNPFLISVLSRGGRKGLPDPNLMVEISAKQAVKELCNFICKKIL
jgi:hypothetical protein